VVSITQNQVPFRVGENHVIGVGRFLVPLEKRPFESWAEVNALAEQLAPIYGPMIVFAAATGLRPGEWIAFEHRDLDHDARVVYVRRAFPRAAEEHQDAPECPRRAAADGCAGRARTVAGATADAAPVSRGARRLSRPPQFPRPRLETRIVAAFGGRFVDGEGPINLPDRKSNQPDAADFAEPSDGLEPSTPSLPWSFRRGTSGHGKALATTFSLQIRPSGRVCRARACPDGPDLMYPSGTRGSLTFLTTNNKDSCSLCPALQATSSMILTSSSRR